MAGCILWVTREVLGLNAAVAARMALPAASPHLTAVLTVVPCFGVPHGDAGVLSMMGFLIFWCHGTASFHRKCKLQQPPSHRC